MICGNSSFVDYSVALEVADINDKKYILKSSSSAVAGLKRDFVGRRDYRIILNSGSQIHVSILSISCDIRIMKDVCKSIEAAEDSNAIN